VPREKKLVITPEQESLIPLWRERWRQHLLCTAPADRATAEAAVPKLYEIHSRPAPERIVWLDSPLALKKLIPAAERDDRHIVRLPCFYVQQPARYSSYVSFDNSINRSIARYYTRVRRHLDIAFPRIEPIDPLRQLCVYGQLSGYLSACAYYDFCFKTWRKLGARRSAKEARLAISLAKSVGGVVMTTRSCYLIERWATIALDAQNRLHSVTGPALKFRDGTEFFAYHGDIDHRFGDLLRRAKSLTVKDLCKRDHSQAVREYMIEIYKGGIDQGGGLAALFSDLSRYQGYDIWHTILDHDPQVGTLHSAMLGNYVVRAVHVKNATREPDGSVRSFWLRVPPTMSSARTAVAWTFRLSGRHYDPVIES
jgi:hypothetical protein